MYCSMEVDNLIKIDNFSTKRLEKEKFISEIPERLHYAFETLKYSQGLIEFVDSKAGILLVVNSIFLATATSIMEAPLSSPFGFFNIMKILFLTFSIGSLILSLLVVSPKGENTVSKRKDMIFFADILQYKKAEDYMFEFNNTREPVLLEDVLRRSYKLAEITDFKFNRYHMAQKITFFSCILWILCIFMIYVIH